MYNDYIGFSDHFAVHVVIWGFIFFTTVFLFAAGAFAKNE